MFQNTHMGIPAIHFLLERPFDGRKGQVNQKEVTRRLSFAVQCVGRLYQARCGSAR